MAHLEPPEPLLDEARAAFLQRHVSINVGARNRHNVPTLARALGCRVSPDRRRVTVFLAVRRAEAVLQGLRENGAIAVVVSRPSTHETLQLKGTDARVEPLAAGDEALMAAYLDSFAAELQGIGHSDPFARAVVSERTDETVAVTFTPTAAFNQTPGPRAGRNLGSPA